MKVNLAAQVLSRSVAEALSFASQHSGVRGLEDVSGTVQFLKMFDEIFDLLNSKTPITSGTKAHMKPSNKETWMNTITQGQEYILGLKDNSGRRLVDTKTKDMICGIHGMPQVRRDDIQGGSRNQ